MKELSVVLLNYNHAHWLRRSLHALADQADDSIEILVVDDGSTDNSIAVIEQLARIYPSIRPLRHERNKGVSAGIETGLGVASGEFLFFAAADDLVLPGLFRCAIAALRENREAALFCSGTVLIDPDGQIIGFRPVTPPRATAGYISPAAVRRALEGTDNWFVGSSVIYRRRPLEAIGYFDKSLGSLADGMANRLLALRHGFWYEPQVLSAWRRYPGSQSGQVAMSATASERSLAAAGCWIAANFPADVRDKYAQLFDRRYRYNLARLRLEWGGVDWGALAGVLKLQPFDCAIVKMLSRIPALNASLVLLWITLRLRPFALTRLAAAWWRTVAIDPGRRAALQHLLAAHSPLDT